MLVWRCTIAQRSKMVEQRTNYTAFQWTAAALIGFSKTWWPLTWTCSFGLAAGVCISNRYHKKLNKFYSQFQWKNSGIMVSDVQAFKKKLEVWEKNLYQGDVKLFPCLKKIESRVHSLTTLKKCRINLKFKKEISETFPGFQENYTLGAIHQVPFYGNWYWWIFHLLYKIVSRRWLNSRNGTHCSPKLLFLVICAFKLRIYLAIHTRGKVSCFDLCCIKSHCTVQFYLLL